MKISLTKYYNTNSLNYCNNEYKLNEYSGGTDWNNVLKLWDIPISTSILYYKFTMASSSPAGFWNLTFSLYSDSALTTKVSEATRQIIAQSYGNTYMWEKINFISQGTSSIGGYSILNLVPISGSLDFTATGYIDCIQVVDYFEESKCLIDFITGIDKERMNNFSIEYTCSDIDLKMSNITGTTSYLGRTLFNFLNEVDQYNFIRAVVHDDSNKIVFVGIIDNKSFEYNYNIGDDYNTVKFRVYSLEADLRTAQQGTTVFETINIKNDWTNNEIGFHDFMLKTALAFGCLLDDEIDFDAYYLSETGSTITLNNDFLLHQKEVNLWDWFKEICKVGGILFETTLTDFNIARYDKPILRLFYPDQNNTSVTISQVMEETRGDKGFNYEGVILDLGILASEGVNYNNFWIQEIGNLYYLLAQKINDGLYYQWGTGDKLDYSNKFFMDINKYECDIDLAQYNKITSLISSGAFNGAGYTISLTDKYYLVAKYLFKNRYRHFLNNFKDTITIKVPYSDITDIDLYNKFYYADKWWYAEKMYNIDLINKTFKINAVQL